MYPKAYIVPGEKAPKKFAEMNYMPNTLNFDTPASSTPRVVNVTGTVARNSTAYLTIRANVSNSSTSSRNRQFYRTITYDNSTGNTALAVSASYSVAIVPKLLGSDTVNVVAAWSYTPTGV